MIGLSKSLNTLKPVWVEPGLQTIHEKSTQSINRGDALPVFENAYQRLKAAGLTVIVHVILGLPGETIPDMLETIRCLSSLEPVLDGIKLQLLQILEETRLGREYREHPFPVMTLTEYEELLVRCLKQLNPDTVIHCITGDGPKHLLIEPKWCADKKHVLNTLNRMIKEA